MQYKGFEITAFEQTPGKWRARIIRANGKPWKGNHRELLESLTGTHLSSAVDALTLAMEAVDAAPVLLRTSETVAAARIRLPRKNTDGDVCRGKLVSLTTSFENRSCTSYGRPTPRL